MSLIENYTHESRSSWAALKVTTTPLFKSCIFTQFVPGVSTKTPLPHFQTTFWHFHLGSLTLKVSRGWECNNGPRAKYIAAVVCRTRCNTGKVASDVFQDTASLLEPYEWNLWMSSILGLQPSKPRPQIPIKTGGHLGSRYIYIYISIYIYIYLHIYGCLRK